MNEFMLLWSTFEKQRGIGERIVSVRRSWDAATPTWPIQTSGLIRLPTASSKHFESSGKSGALQLQRA